MIEEGNNKDQTKTITGFIQSMESVETLCEFRYLSLEQAKAAADKKEIIAYILLPDDVYDDINYGKNTPIKVVASPALTTREKNFFRLLYHGISLLQTSEAAVYASYDFFSEYPPNRNTDEAIDQLTFLLAGEVLARNKTFDSHLLSSLGNYSNIAYYFCAGVIFLLLLQGISFSYLYQKENLAFEEKLASNGLKEPVLGLLHVFLITMVCLILLVLMYTLLVLFPVLEYAYSFRWRNLLLFLPLAISVASFIHIIYSLTGNSKNGLSSYLLFVILIMILSGLLIPNAFFPTWAELFSRYSPVTIWHQYLLELLYMDSIPTNIYALFLIIIFTFLLGGVLKCIKKQ